MDRFLSLLILCIGLNASAFAEDSRLWLKVKAQNSQERSTVANVGLAIETVASDYVIGIANEKERDKLREMGLLLEETPLNQVASFDFPKNDSAFHNYSELTEKIKNLARQNPDIMSVESLGQSVEGREIWHVRLSTELESADSKPGIAFMGGHHAREHLSVEVPLLLIEKLIAGFRSGDSQIKKFFETRDIHIVPVVNPDGKEYDISTGRYRYWRKSRAQVSETFYGVDLNRNYGFMWGTGGSSSDPKSETYKGPTPFSEPETQAIKKFIENQHNVTILLSFHTFSELILYPWGHKYDSIENQRDFLVHKTMAETMAQWNGYTPQQSSDLYIASGDTTDWSYGQQHVVSFTFELDPKDMFSGGFYPGASEIDIVSAKNWQPCLYLIEYADNPYRVLEPAHITYGLNSPLIQ